MPVRSEIFSTNGAIAASSCGAAALGQPTFDFGFMASSLRIVNTCGPRLFYKLGGAASTIDAYISCGDTLALDGHGLATTGLGLSTTSTSTAAGAAPLYAVSAYASA